MYRGTTPTIVFRVDTSLKLINMKQIWVTLKSNITKRTFEIDRLKINEEDNTVTLKLKQEDTLFFHSGKVFVQLRFLDKKEKAYATAVKQIDMKDILEEGVIDGKCDVCGC